MSGVQSITVSRDEAGLRLDRWFRQHFPGLRHGQLEKLLRTGQIRVDGKRVKGNFRIARDQQIRVPPLDPAATEAPTRKPAQTAPVDKRLLAELVAAIVLKDAAVLVLNKPAGLAVQGGSGTTQHVDGLLDGLRFGASERPRLVHRLDKDTSGALVLARTRAAARALTEAFRQRDAAKTYWALVAGAPNPERGMIDLALSKSGGAGNERARPDAVGGKPARTAYALLDHAGDRAAWLALRPETGRTHQLRVHCAAIGAPVLGDGKYGGRAAFLPGWEQGRGLCLHAQAIDIRHPAGGRLAVTCPPPAAFLAAMRDLGFDPATYEDPFIELDG